MPGREPRSDGIDVRCHICGEQLPFLPDSYPLAFRCETGHLLILEDLLNHDDPRPAGTGETAVRTTLKSWKDRALLLRELAGRALRNGHAFAAADFQEAGNRIDDWAARLATMISTVEPRQLPP